MAAITLARQEWNNLKPGTLLRWKESNNKTLFLFCGFGFDKFGAYFIPLVYYGAQPVNQLGTFNFVDDFWIKVS